MRAWADSQKDILRQCWPNLIRASKKLGKSYSACQSEAWRMGLTKGSINWERLWKKAQRYAKQGLSGVEIANRLGCTVQSLYAKRWLEKKKRKSIETSC